MATSTINPNYMADTYADTITTLRVYRYGPEHGGYSDAPWQVDGFNENTGEVTQEVANFSTFDAAFAGAQGFLCAYGYEFEPVVVGGL